MKRNRRGRKVAAFGMAATLSLTSFAISPIRSDAVFDDASGYEDTALACEIAKESMVLLKNENQTLPLKKGSNIAVFGTGQSFGWQAGALGSSTVSSAYETDLIEGLQGVSEYITINQDILSLYEAAQNDKSTTEEEKFNYAPNLSEIQAAAAKSDTAVIIISRTSGEGSDTSLTEDTSDNDKPWYYRYYDLTEEEKEMIQNVTASFENVAVVLNMGSLMDYWLEDSTITNDNIDAVLYAGLPGIEGGAAIAQTLVGLNNPSGHLSDTWAYDIYDHPSTANVTNKYNTQTFVDGYTSVEVTEEVNAAAWKSWTGMPKLNPPEVWVPGTYTRAINDHFFTMYEESIFVGYRYFETFGVEVAYPFGYGLSYTNFTQEVVDSSDDGENITVKVKVTNTGTEAGKDVAQIYYRQPEGTVKKSSIELGGYAKTDTLEPGESQVLTISYPISYMYTYYEDQNAYILDQGAYEIYAGTDVESVSKAYTYILDEAVTVESSYSITDLEDGYEESFTEMTGASTFPNSADLLPSCVNIRGACVDESIGTVYNFHDFAVSSEDSGTAGVTEQLQEALDAAKESSAQKKEEGSIYQLVDVYNGLCSLETFIGQLSDVELICLVNGTGNMGSDSLLASSYVNSGSTGRTTHIEDYGIPDINMSDGPHGVGSSKLEWPSEINQACTWNLDLIEEMGLCIGEELEGEGIDLWLAPNINLHRNPLNGRNAEAYSEDPVLCGTMGAAATLGVQATGHGAVQKHYVVYDVQSGGFYNADQIMTERTLRELYLKEWQISVTTANPWAIMNSYNMLNGTFASNDQKINQVLRDWGWDGLYMTDWDGSDNSPVTALNGGTDLIMPSYFGAVSYQYQAYCEAQKTGAVKTNETGAAFERETLERAAANLCKLIMKTKTFAEYCGIEQSIDQGEDLAVYLSVSKSTPQRESSSTQVPVQGISLNQDTLELTVGATATLKATVIPANATNQNVTWSSNNPKVVSVENGKVSALTAGTAVITAKTQDGGKMASCTVTVKKPTVKLNVKSVKLQVGKSTTAIKASGMLAGDEIKEWKSSKPSVAAVGKKGKIKAKKVGTTVITVTTRQGATASCKLQVTKKAVKTSKLSVTNVSDKKLTLKKGQTYTLKVTRKPVTATDKLTYQSSKKSVATITKKGKIKAKKKGSAIITIKAAGGAKVRIKLKIKK